MWCCIISKVLRSWLSVLYSGQQGGQARLVSCQVTKHAKRTLFAPKSRGLDHKSLPDPYTEPNPWACRSGKIFTACRKQARQEHCRREDPGVCSPLLCFSSPCCFSLSGILFPPLLLYCVLGSSPPRPSYCSLPFAAPSSRPALEPEGRSETTRRSLAPEGPSEPTLARARNPLPSQTKAENRPSQANPHPNAPGEYDFPACHFVIAVPSHSTAQTSFPS